LWLNLKRPWLVAVGDDRTDEDMFRAVGAKGLTIRVGRPRRSRARYRLAGPDDVRCFLKKSLAAMNE
jgi:trehalose 6-phosphate synthase/phosphatase